MLLRLNSLFKSKSVRNGSFNANKSQMKWKCSGSSTKDLNKRANWLKFKKMKKSKKLMMKFLKSSPRIKRVVLRNPRTVKSSSTVSAMMILSRNHQIVLITLGRSNHLCGRRKKLKVTINIPVQQNKMLGNIGPSSNARQSSKTIVWTTRQDLDFQSRFGKV